MSKQATVREVTLHFLPVEMRVPLKFGSQVLDSVTCARARVIVEGSDGRFAEGWGETPLSVAWVWPASIDYEDRHEALKAFTINLAKALNDFGDAGHPIEIGHDFIEHRLPQLQDEFNADRGEDRSLPHLAALVCFSLLDIAVHDAYGHLYERPTYSTYNRDFLSRDLGDFLDPAASHVAWSRISTIVATATCGHRNGTRRDSAAFLAPSILCPG